MKDKLMRGGNDVIGLIDLIKVLPSNLIGVEIGCYAGESTSAFLKSGKFKKLYCVDWWSTTYYTDRGNGEGLFDALIAKYPDIAVKVKIDCNKILSYFADKDINIDFIYIDGEHKYEQVSVDIKNSLVLLKNRGILAGHDYHKPKPGVIKAVDEFFTKPDVVFKDTSWLIYLNERNKA